MIIPIVDFNGNRVVEATYRDIQVARGGENYPPCDIGPMPWGDGMVDAADRQVLTSYWDQEILNPALVARLRLDEAEGVIADDSVGANHGAPSGNPPWQAAGGKSGGVLLLDGIFGHDSRTEQESTVWASHDGGPF